MELFAQIRKYRMEMNWSQEELAEKVYVSRQTISNWENGKNYPDLHSLLLLSTVFQVSLDQLVKGDVEIMREEIQENEIRKLNRYGRVYSILLAVMVISPIPLLSWIGAWALLPWGVLVGVTLYIACRVEKVKKENHIATYKEIVAFSEGRRLDEMERQQELGKRPYQRVLLTLGSAVIAFLVCYLMGKLFL